jgi:hypothetical protein
MALEAGSIEKLVKLIADEKRVDEKIRDTQAALTLVEKSLGVSGAALHFINARAEISNAGGSYERRTIVRTLTASPARHEE